MVVLLGILLLLCVVGWFWLNSFVKSKVESQLADAGFQDSKVGSVQVGFGGVTANSIQVETEGVTASIGQLIVDQSIFELARGKAPIDKVTVSDVDIAVDFRALDGDSDFSLADLDLVNIDLPLNEFKASNFRFKLFDEDGEVEIEIDDATVAANDASFDIVADTNFLDGDLAFNGSIDRATTDLNIAFEGDDVHLVDQQWQRWPGLGPAVLKHLGADSVFDVTGNVSGNLKSGIKYLADIDTKDASLYIPKFDLPIAIHEAEVRIQDGLVTYRKVLAGMGDDDIVNATGTTTIDGLPCRSKFQGDFTDVDVADLRKLVKEIPLKVVGTATGEVVGSVDVNEDLETTLRIDANGDTFEASYGEIAASSGNVDVQIQPLVLTQLGKTIDLQGAVTVKAKTQDQNVNGVLATFDLQELDRQFEFEMLGSGNVDLVIPLNSAADLRTWTLEIESQASTGSVGGMSLEDIRIKSFLDDGQLVFDPAMASLVGERVSSVNVKVKWPLPNRAADSIADTGVVEASGNNVPPVEAVQFFNRQMENAGIDYKFKPQMESLVKSDIGGGISFGSRIELPSGNDRPIESWKVKASVSDSSLHFANEKLNKLRSAITIEDGLLNVSGLSGLIESGGDVAVDASFSLLTSELLDGQIRANAFPASWLGSAIIRMDSSGTFVERTGLNAKNVNEKLVGSFDAQIRVDPDQDNRILWDANSDELVIYGKTFSNVLASGKYDSAFDIKRIKAEFPGGGKAQLEGDWIAGSDDGKFNLVWKKVSLVPLLEDQISLPESFESLSDGELEITFKDSSPIFTGEFDLVEPKALGGTFADHRFEIETVNGRIHFRDIPGKQNGISLDGTFGIKRPFDFELKGETKAMSLSTAAFDKLSGVATSKFKLAGQASPWSVRSSGMARFRELRFGKESLSEIESTWNFDTDRQDQQLKINGFGGTATLDSMRGQSDDLFFEIEKLDLAELAAFRKLPVELSGAVTGGATIKNWRSAAKRSVTAEATGKLIRVGRARLARVNGKATLSAGGKVLDYSMESQLIDGKLVCSGKTKLGSVSSPFDSTFPINVRLVNGRLNRFVESLSNSPTRELKQLQGRVSLSMDWEVTPGVYPKGSGIATLEDVKYRGQLVSRKIFSDIALKDGIMQLKRINADLQQGEISGRATIPLLGSTSGSYDLAVRNFSLPRMLQVLLKDPVEASGLVNARISGRTGRTITGAGTLGVSQAGLFGVSSQEMKVPIRFRIEPTQRQVRIEMPNTRFKAFRGTVDGSARLDIGSRIRLDSNLQLSNIDSKTLVRSLTGYNKPGNGKLSGKLIIKGRNIQTEKDLVGSFRGNLKQSNALSFPLLDQASRFLGNSPTLRNDQFDSDTIELSLSKGRVDVKQFRLQNALVSIVINGDAWLNGKLDLEIAARVERLNQPTLLDQLAGSPIARVVGPEAAFFAQAAEFLSERIVFLDVTGSASRPQLRLNPGKQLKEEAIRYFLRGSQILPNGNPQNN